jgi:hypothetical protein
MRLCGILGNHRPEMLWEMLEGGPTKRFLLNAIEYATDVEHKRRIVC